MANERINFVQNLICNVIAQTMGDDYYPASGTDANHKLAAVDTWTLVDVGKDVETMNKKDVFTKALMI